MGSSSSKFRKHLQAGDEVQALQLYRTNSELRKALDPNCSYGDSHQHETPLHLAAKHGMQILLGIFLFSKGGNPKKTNARKETCLHCVCIETNSQSVHVGKRRADCLTHLLKWRGATLAEGQLEKIDLAAQDEKLNTALHYAAASGLTQCVEILIQHGAPLFIENEDNMTPCDTAEKNGHARIALYLESKMVFSNDEELHEEKDNVSMPPVEEYSGLRPQDLQEAKDHLLVETADMLSVPLFTAEALLRNHEWSREMLLEAWMNDPIACCEKCGVTPPSTLFSEKPQVQENLASPLPSPLHTIPSPQDAECNICANTFLIADEPVHMTCTHLFCKDCWERYLNVKIQEGDAHRITCPAYDCTMLVPIDIIERIVSRDMALRYLQFDIKAFVDSNPDMKWCPYPGCGRAVKLPDLDLGSNQGIKRNKIPSDTSRGVDCGVGHYFCWECLEESHEPCSCENWSKWYQKISEIKPETLDGTEQETELAANCLWLVTNSKPCPNCKSPIQKNEGCNHMKCSKCKYDFCWVCLEQWKRHNSSTGGYFKCNRYEVLKKVEEQSAQLVSEAEIKNRNMQELNRFVHYYTRFKNHENSYKLEEPLLKTVKDKMMKLAEAVTDVATAHTETKFVEDAVQQLLKARRVLKCSYVYGFYLDGPGYKKIVFEFMQTELEECTEILSQMVNRLYLRTPRRKIMDQAHFVQRKRLELIMAISKGLVPPETPPSVRKSKMKRKISGGEADDEDLHRAIVASIQEVDPANPWIKDASGRHTNVVALLDWPSDDSEQSEGESELRAARESIGKCHRSGCNKVRVKNPRTNEHHDYCSRWCMQVDKEDQNRKETEGISEIVLDEHMELLRALEMSRLQYLRDNGLLHVPDTRDTQQSPLSNISISRGQNYRHRPRSNSAGQEAKVAGEHEETTSEKKRSLTKSKTHHCHRLSQSSRFDECRSTIVTRVPNKSVEDLYSLDQTSTLSSAPDDSQNQEEFDETSRLVSANLLDNPGTIAAHSIAALPGGENSSHAKVACSSPSGSYLTSDEDHLSSCSSPVKGIELIGSMFGVIKDISVSNIHSNESDKTKDFLSKDLASIFASWDSDINALQANTDSGCARRPLTLENSSGRRILGRASSGQSLVKSNRLETEMSARRSLNNEQLTSIAPQMACTSRRREDNHDKSWLWLADSQLSQHIVGDENVSGKKLQSSSLTVCEDFSTKSLLEMAENLLQMTADVDSRMKEVEDDIDGSDITTNNLSIRTDKSRDMGSLVSTSSENTCEKIVRNTDDSILNDRVNRQRRYESIIDKDTGDKQQQMTNQEKIYLPRTAWAIENSEEDTATKWSPTASKANRKSTSSHKTKVFDFDGGHKKLPRKISSKSRKAKCEPVAVRLMHDVDSCAYEVPFNWKPSGDLLSESSSSGFKLNMNKTFEMPPSSISLHEQDKTTDISSSSLLSCTDQLLTDENSLSFKDIETTGVSNAQIESNIVRQSSSVGNTDDSTNMCLSTSLFSLLKSDVIEDEAASSSSVANRGGVEDADTSGLSDNNCVEYSLTRNISFDRLSQYSIYTAEVSDSENHIEVADLEIIERNNDDDDDDDENINVIVTSALNTDAYETAASDDNWEDASSVLPSDKPQSSMNDNLDCEVVDDDDDDELHSLYV